MGAFAWVTLATNDSYSLGALVLAHSLKQAGTAHQLAVLVTPGVTSAMREKLGSVFNVVQEVNILDSRDEANLKLLKRPELGITFTKLHCWRLTQFEKCVFLDADTLVLQNADELFEREELSAAPDVGWPDCFNSGVFVYRPSLDTYEKLIQFALEKGSFDGGDQGLLNLYFSDWAHKDISKHLPFIYNMCSTACYSYLPAFKQFGANAKIVHFIGAQKPWLQYFNTETRRVQPSGDASHLQEILQRWWDIFCSLIHPVLSPAMAGLAGAFSQLTLGVPRTAEQDALENVLRKQAWEVGNIDYLGKDSFANIWSKITETLSVSAPAPAESQSQSAPQEEVSPIQPQVPPVDSSKTETPIEVPVETKEEIQAAPQELSPEVPAQVAPIESSTSAPVSEAAKVVEEVVTSSEAVAAATAPVEPVACPITPKQPVAEPLACPIAPKEVASELVKEVTPQQVVESQPVAPPESPQTPVAETPKAEAPPVVAQAPPETVVAPSSATPVAETPQPQVESVAPPSPATPVAETPQPQVESVAAPSPATPVAEAPQPTVKTVAEPSPATPPAKTQQSQPDSAVTPSPATPVVETPQPQPETVLTPSASTPQPTQQPSPATKVIEATPPVTPGTPPIEKTKQALAAEANIPDTPPPSEGGSTPTPPPRKTDKPKKAAAKPKK